MFSRTASSGALTRLSGMAGCLTPDGNSASGAGTCTKVRGFLDSPGDGRDLAMTSDGKWAYFATQNSNGGPGHGAVVVFRRNRTTGALTQLTGAVGCIDASGADQDGNPCQKDTSLSGPQGISLSPDQKFVYVIDYENNSIHVFARNATTGALSEVQCVAEGSIAGCTVGRVLGNSQSLAITPNGRFAYGGDYVAAGISLFDRNSTTGKLTQIGGPAGCITDTGKDSHGNAGACQTGRVLNGAYALTISPDGRTLYVPAEKDSGVSIFHIAGNGALTQLAGTAGCITESGHDQNGHPCRTGRGLSRGYGTTVSPDGHTLYVTTRSNQPGGGVAVFSLNRSTGDATQLSGIRGCLSSDGSDNGTSGVCTEGRDVNVAYEVAVSPDLKSVYVAAKENPGPVAGGVAVFARETAPECSRAKATTKAGTTVTVHLGCADPDGQGLRFSVAKKPAHGTLGPINQPTRTVTYKPATGFTGIDNFKFTATDGTNTSTPATASIKVTAP